MTGEGARSAIFPGGLDGLRRAVPEAEAARLWPSLERLDWVALLPSRSAPGFFYIAGAVGGAAVGGGGRDLAEAAGRAAGEAAEALAEPAPGAAMTNLADGRRAPLAQTLPASLGLAAGRSFEAARLAGLLEVIERDAAHAWWRGETRPRALDAAVSAPVAMALATMRQGAEVARATGFLALDAAADVPVVCAYSVAASGTDLALGLKAAPHARAAADGAMIELLQMELALELALRRAETGTAGLGDAGPLGRAALEIRDLAAFATCPPRVGEALLPADAGELADRLSAQGVEVWAADLAGPEGGLAVAKVVAPALGRAGPARSGSPAEHAPLM